MPGAADPTREIGTLRSILDTAGPEAAGDQAAEAVETWETAVDDILREQ